MLRVRILCCLLVMCAVLERSAAAHPAPFTFLDVRVQDHAIDLSLVAHVFDVGHDLGIDPPDQLLQQASLATQGPAFAALLANRVRLTADGRALPPARWSVAEALPERQSIRLETRITFEGAPGVIGIDARLFPYDPAHQTFVNVHEHGALTAQTILDVGRTTFTYYAGTVGGRLAVVRALVPGGMKHVLVGLEHLVMMLGLLLTGATRRQAVLIASAFTVGHALTLTLATLNVLTPPARLVDPAVALSIVYVGVDNLMIQDGRDIRGWMSMAFGAIHGVGFASVLRSMELPRPALVWSLVSFNLGIEMGQVLLALVVGLVLTAITRTTITKRAVAVAGSVIVIAIGTYEFIQRVFFA